MFFSSGAFTALGLLLDDHVVINGFGAPAGAEVEDRDVVVCSFSRDSDESPKESVNFTRFLAGSPFCDGLGLTGGE